MRYRVLSQIAAICRGGGGALSLMLLGAMLAGAAQAADAPPPRSLISDEILAAYRTDLSCHDGRGFGRLRDLLRLEAGEARSATYLEHGDAQALSLRIAADYDRAAQVAAARGCPEQAQLFWTYLLDDYRGPAFAALRDRAEAGLRGLP